MLLISRKQNEAFVIGSVIITVAEIRGDKVWLKVGLRPPLDPAWLTWQDGTVLRLAKGIAEKGDYAALPILADALEEAGCANADILGHCRSCRQVGRGSWVVDLILSAS